VAASSRLLLAAAASDAGGGHGEFERISFRRHKARWHQSMEFSSFAIKALRTMGGMTACCCSGPPIAPGSAAGECNISIPHRSSWWMIALLNISSTFSTHCASLQFPPPNLNIPRPKLGRFSICSLLKFLHRPSCVTDDSHFLPADCTVLSSGCSQVLTTGVVHSDPNCSLEISLRPIYFPCDLSLQ
jgi:hypothetical protein